MLPFGGVYNAIFSSRTYERTVFGRNVFEQIYHNFSNYFPLCLVHEDTSTSVVSVFRCSCKEPSNLL